MGYVRQNKMVQGKDTLYDKKILPCRRLLHVPLLFLHWFLRFTLLLLMHHSGKLTIPHDNVFILLQILHLVLFKSLQRQGELSISSDSHVVFWWDRDGNRRLIYHWFGTDLLRSILVLFLSVIFELLSSLCCNNASRIASLSVAGQQLSRYQVVPLTS